MAFLSPFPGVPIIRFLAITKNGASTLPLIPQLLQQVLEEVSGTGMLWPLLMIFLRRFHFFNFCKKMQKRK